MGELRKAKSKGMGETKSMGELREAKSKGMGGTKSMGELREAKSRDWVMGMVVIANIKEKQDKLELVHGGRGTLWVESS